jgi:hypothetical protein
VVISLTVTPYTLNICQSSVLVDVKQMNGLFVSLHSNSTSTHALRCTDQLWSGTTPTHSNGSNQLLPSQYQEVSVDDWVAYPHQKPATMLGASGPV